MGSINSKIANIADLNSLSAAEVALIVKSLGKAYEPIADAVIVDNYLEGDDICDALDDEGVLNKLLDTIGATEALNRDKLKKLLKKTDAPTAPVAILYVSMSKVLKIRVAPLWT
jgi:hypothetical protein